MKKYYSNIKLKGLSKGDIRYKSHMGRDYIVVPAVMLVEGVHVGHGLINKILYPSAALETNINVWPTKPITFGHAFGGNGEILDTSTPDILDKIQIGLIYNSRIESKKLKADAWLDVERTEKIAPRLLDRIRGGEEIEVSVDVDLDAIRKKGTFDGIEYEAEAINIYPKALAILDGERGACSVEKGCGIRNCEYKKENGCNECQNIKQEDKMADTEKNKTTDEQKGMLEAFGVMLSGLLKAKGCGCSGGDDQNAAGKNTSDKGEVNVKLSSIDDVYAHTDAATTEKIKAALALVEVQKEAQAKKGKELIGEIIKLSSEFSESDLTPLPTPALEKIKASLSKKGSVDYSMNAGQQDAPGEAEAVDFLPIPSWANYEPKQTN